MRFAITLLLTTALAACGAPPQFDREVLSDEPGSPAAVAGTTAPGPARITVLDVGQGDSILIESPSGDAMLIDAGPPDAGRDAVLPYLEEMGITSLTEVVLTHDHIDHTGGLIEILAGPDGLPGTEDDITLKGEIHVHEEIDEGPFEPEHEWGEDNAAPYRTPLPAGELIELGDVDITAVASGGHLMDGQEIDEGDPPDENTRSIVLLLEYSGFRMLLAGDVTGGGGNPPYDTPDVETPLGNLVGDIDVLKVAHHGSLTSTNESFLASTTPEIAIISVGDGNDHFHPHGSVIERLIDAGISVYQTERGWLDITGPFVADGNVTVEVERDGEYRIVLE